MIVSPAAATNAYQGSPRTTAITMVTSTRELNEGNSLPIAYVLTLAVSAPATAAMNAEMQKTSTRITLTLTP